MDSTIAPDRHSTSAERVDSSSVLVAKVNKTVDDTERQLAHTLAPPSFSLYRFVISSLRTSGAEYIYPFLLERPG